MTSRLIMTKKDPRRTDFVPAVANANDDDASSRKFGYHLDGRTTPTYTSDTTHFARPRNGCRALTTVTRTDHTGDRLQVGVIEWPEHILAPTQLVVGTRDVRMSKVSAHTSSERFTAMNGMTYEWQVHDSRPQLVPLRGNSHSTSYVATFVQSQSGFWFRRKHTSSLFIPPEGYDILDDIVVTFIYFAGKWRDKEGDKARSSLSGGIA
ncbi:hypothetical protein EV363DRAFT_1337977 [Boletus edulis]|uniref:DUF6593 domain-containing protein n=1 Tax=Boletus edulis BED1 TaxID=1328754 RepID=A0AAD4GD73_BOLED|nr:hypothetical protein EV363DRAFT_1337977 [Boletus edulis]KAF8437516.1 hypothetical protein L210DRAFT_3545859 [Boletus edulis BED1]